MDLRAATSYAAFMDPNASHHMSPEEFRRCGYAVVDWMAEYQKNVAMYPVLSQAKPGDIRALLPAQPPIHGDKFEDILADVNRVIMPGITHWQSPNFFAFFPANNSGPSILGEMISSALGVQGMLWATSPSCTELETHVLDWIVDMAALPGHFKSCTSGGGVIQDSASSAVLCAIIAARHRALESLDGAKSRLDQLVAYTSTQAHSSVEKALRIAGVPRESLRLIDVDEHLAFRPDMLRETIEKDIRSGLKPFFVSATVGTTSTNAFDPLLDLGEICRQHGLWFHVDGAMCGTAALCPEFRHRFAGLELADSYCFNPHKWMFTNFDCDCFYVRDRKPLIQALSILPEYLRNKATESGAVIDYRDWQIPLGRRFRSLKLWFVLRHYGLEGLQCHIRKHVAMAQQFAGWVGQSSLLELVTPAPMNLVCFAHRGGNDCSKQLLEAVNATGKIYMTHTLVRDRYTLRFCVGQTNTDEHHVGTAWQLISCIAARLS